MKQYEYLDHTAEAKFIAYGRSLEEAFINAALATENIMIKTEDIEPKIKKHIIVETKHLKGLLYDFLQEFIILFDSEFFALHKIEDLIIKNNNNEYYLQCTCYGDDAHNYETLSGVKAVTYNEMEIVEKNKIWNITVVLDV